MPHITAGAGTAGMMGLPLNHMSHFDHQHQHGGYTARKPYGGLPEPGRASGASSPDAEYQQKFYQQHQQYSGFRPDVYPGMIPPQHRRESVLVILDGNRMNTYRGSMDKRAPVPIASAVVEESDEETTAFFDGDMKNTRRGNQMHQQVSDNDDADESEMDDEERRRYVKRQRHRSLIDSDGVHEIRFDNPSTEASSSSESSSPKSGGEHDDEDGIIMIDAGEGDDNGSRRNLMDIDIEREGDAARVLEEMKMYTVGMKQFGPTNGIKGVSATRK